MKIKAFDFLSKYVSEYKISYLLEAGGPCGVLLLFRPILYSIFSRRRDLNAYASVDSSALIFIAYAFIGFIVALRELSSSNFNLGPKMLRHSGLNVFLMFSILSFASMFWSVNLQLTGFRAFECLGMFLMIVMTLNRLFSYHNLNLVLDWSILWAVLECAISIIKTLSYTTNISEILETNQMFAPFFFYIALLSQRKKFGHYLVMAFSIFSMSTVAYIGMALGLIGIGKGGKNLKILALILGVCVTIAMIIMGPRQLLKDTLFFDKEDISLEQTSGRDKLMNAAFESASINPIGTGFFAGEPELFYKRGLAGINAHNAIFSSLIGCGYLGGALMILFLIVMLFNVRSKYIHPDYRAPLFCCFCVAIVECMGNPSIGSRVYGAWIGEMYIFCLIAAFYCYGRYYKNHEIKNL